MRSFGSLFIGVVSFCVINVVATNVSAQYSERQSLGLEGCYTTDIRYSPDAKNLFITCEAPKGVFWSVDHGGQWTFAEGGSYSSGSVRGIAVTQYGVVFGTDKNLYAARFAEDGTFSPNWQELSDVQITRQPLVSQSGKFVIVGSDTLSVVDTQSMTVVQSNVPLPVSEDVSMNLLEAGSTHLFVLFQGSDVYGNKLYRASFDSSTGSVGDFEEITNGHGLAVDSYIWNLRVHPLTGKVFVDCRNTHVNPMVEALYVSDDNGTSFYEFPSSNDIAANKSFNDACFSSDPNIFLLGSLLTTDGGNSFSDTGIDKLNETEGGQEGACAIDPTTATRAFLRTAVGVARTENLSSVGAQTWTRATKGLDGVTVYHMSKGNSNGNRVLLASSAGFGLSENFESDSPTWTFPICPGGDCAIFETGSNIVIDPEDESTLYAGGWNVYKGSVTDGQASWQQFLTRPSGADIPGGGVGVIYKASELPGLLVVGWKWGNGSEYPLGGALNFYDSTSGALSWSGLEKPVSSLIALNSTLLFAGIGYRHDSAPTNATRGIYKSMDGGHTWTQVTSSSMDANVFVRGFAYDSKNDLLYAAGLQTGSPGAGGMYVLSNASKGGDNWSKASTEVQAEKGEAKGNEPDSQIRADSFEAVSVDESTGNVYGITGNVILVSPDKGQTWIQFFEGMSGEQMKVIDAGERQEASNDGIKAISRKIVQGSNVGLNALTATKTYPFCKITVSAKCRKTVKKGTQCKLTSSLYDVFSHSAFAKRKIQIQKRANLRSKWSKAKVAKTSSKGVVSLSESLKSTTFFRAVSTSPRCTSSSVRIAVRKK
ncbi:MAG: hypothetical protein GYA55_02730 [SAR324 cluster bacterium]|uniref:Sortilin N-terminal domain-containing protein n=1 Tax=SAR324 cluster bacterium TaxID=2024889 RepID=A0A7X9FPT0_9DELT|nr:hypothetical protein [SAR324 cluster bacterium]